MELDPGRKGARQITKKNKKRRLSRSRGVFRVDDQLLQWIRALSLVQSLETCNRLGNEETLRP